MNGDRIWTAAELEVLSPNERDAIVRAGFVTDPDQVPADLLERARRKADVRIAAGSSPDSMTTSHRRRPSPVARQSCGSVWGGRCLLGRDVRLVAGDTEADAVPVLR